MLFRRNNSEITIQEAEHRQKSGPKLKVDGLTEDEQEAVGVYIQAKNLNIENEEHQQLIIKYIKFLRRRGDDGGRHAENGGIGKGQVIRAGYSDVDGGGHDRPSQGVAYVGGLEIPPKLMSLISGAKSRELQMSLTNAHLMIISGKYPESKLAFDHACTNRLFKTAYGVLCGVAEAEEKYREAVDWFSEVQDRFEDGENEILVYSSRADGWLPAILLRINEDGTFVYQLVGDKGKVKNKELLGKNILNLVFEADEDLEADEDDYGN